MKKHQSSQQEGGRLQARRELSTTHQSCFIFIWDFQPTERGENKFLVFKPLSLWYFVLAAQVDQDTLDNTLP